MCRLQFNSVLLFFCEVNIIQKKIIIIISHEEKKKSLAAVERKKKKKKKYKTKIADWLYVFVCSGLVSLASWHRMFKNRMRKKKKKKKNLQSVVAGEKKKQNTKVRGSSQGRLLLVRPSGPRRGRALGSRKVPKIALRARFLVSFQKKPLYGWDLAGWFLSLRAIDWQSFSQIGWKLNELRRFKVFGSAYHLDEQNIFRFHHCTKAWLGHLTHSSLKQVCISSHVFLQKKQKKDKQKTKHKKKV